MIYLLSDEIKNKFIGEGYDSPELSYIILDMYSDKYKRINSQLEKIERKAKKEIAKRNNRLKQKKEYLKTSEFKNLYKRYFYQKTIKKINKSESEQNIDDLIDNLSKIMREDFLFYEENNQKRKNGQVKYIHQLSVLDIALDIIPEYSETLIYTALLHDYAEDHGKAIITNKLKLINESNIDKKIINTERTNKINYKITHTLLSNVLKYLNLDKEKIKQIITNVDMLTISPTEHYLDYITKIVYYDLTGNTTLEPIKKRYNHLEDTIIEEVKRTTIPRLTSIKLSDKLANTLTLRTEKKELFSLSHTIKDLIKNLYMVHTIKMIEKAYISKINSNTASEKHKREELSLTIKPNQANKSKKTNKTNKINKKAQGDIDYIKQIFTSQSINKTLHTYSDYCLKESIKNSSPCSEEEKKSSQYMKNLWSKTILLGFQTLRELDRIALDCFENSKDKYEKKSIDLLIRDPKFIESEYFNNIDKWTEEKKLGNYLKPIYNILNMPSSQINTENLTETEIFTITRFLSNIIYRYITDDSFYLKGFDNLRTREATIEKNINKTIRKERDKLRKIIKDSTQ